MQRIIIAASLVLVVQLGLVSYMYTQGKNFEAYSPDTPLFALSTGAVSSLVFSDSNNQSLRLIKEDGNWLLDVPSKPRADQEQVGRFLDKLAGLKERLAIATTKQAQKRFQVSEDQFEYHLVAAEGNKQMVDLYVGSSQGFRQVHARLADQENILSLPLNAADFVPSIENWIDQGMLQMSEENLKFVKLVDFSLEKIDETWHFTGDEGAVQPDKEEVQKLIDKVTGVTIQSIIAEPDSDGNGSGEAELQYTLGFNDGTEISYSYQKSDQGSYILQVSEQEPLFKIQEWVVDAIKEITREKLLGTIPAEE